MTKKRLYPDDPDWTYKTIVLPKGRVFYNKYYYKRKRAYRIVLDTPKATQLAGYILIEKDLRSCKIWLNEILELVKDDERYVNATQSIANLDNRKTFNIVKGLFVAALTIYGKCFTTCDGRRIKLEKTNLEKKFHEDHDDAISLRHNFAAHSGAKKIEFSRIVVLLDPKKKRENLPRMSSELLQPDAWGVKEIQRFIDLAEQARQYCLSKHVMLTNKTYEEDVLKKGKSYWYERT